MESVTEYVCTTTNLKSAVLYICSDVLYRTETSVFSWPSKMTKVTFFKRRLMMFVISRLLTETVTLPGLCQFYEQF